MHDFRIRRLIWVVIEARLSVSAVQVWSTNQYAQDVHFCSDLLLYGLPVRLGILVDLGNDRYAAEWL